MRDHDKNYPNLMYSHTNGQPQNGLAANFGTMGSMTANQVAAPGQVGLRSGQTQPLIPNGRGKQLHTF